MYGARVFGGKMGENLGFWAAEKGSTRIRV
jgi:hypothetical protein